MELRTSINNMDLQIKDILNAYKLPEPINGRKQTKEQLLALDIIKHFQETDKKWIGMWFRTTKKYYAFVADRFIKAKTDKRPKQYFYRMIFPRNKLLNK